MRWEQHKNDDGYYRLKVEAEWSELVVDYDDIVAEYGKVRIPGFRPGKAPRSVIEKRFQKEITEDLSHRATQRLGREAIRKAGIEALGPAEAEEIECAKGQVFRARLRLHPTPKFDLPDISRLKFDDASTDLRDQISLRLLELVSFDVPDRLVKDELALDCIGDNTPTSAEWKEAKDRIKLMLILKQIARQEGIEVDEKKVNDRIAEKAEEFGTKKKTLQAELEKGGGIARLREMLIAERTLEYLIERNRLQK